MKKLLGGIFKLILIVLILIAIYFILSGFIMYKQCISSISIESKVESIRAAEGYTKIENVPDYYKKAVIAIEDKRFYEHGAIDIKSILRAVVINIKDMSFTEGGSSITQQLAKNLYFSQEKKIERKIAEVFMAYDLESKLNKEDILELYINVIYYGDGYIGIGEASRGYFKKNPEDLNIYEATLLAGIPNAPSVYQLSNENPYTYERQEDVVECMVDQGYITENEAKNILDEGVIN